MKPLLLSINPEYFYKILDWKNKSYELAGSIAVLPGYHRYNQLIKLNCLFSTFPIGDPVDRTQQITGPFNFGVLRPWKSPSQSLTIDQVIQQRVQQYLATDQRLNLCWSGGIDSTCMLAGFLKHIANLDQLRVLYSPFSIYENREFFAYIQQNYPSLELIDISGDTYLETEFDGIVINGHGGDEFTGSLDESFFDQHGAQGLRKPWQEFVRDPELQDFCKEFFALSGRPIDTVLEARWWFYSVAKSQVFSPRDSVFTNAETSAFFDCDLFEDYMWHNTDKIIAGQTYNTYKQFLKQYIYEFDGNENYRLSAMKMNSFQFRWYTRKKTALFGKQWIACLTDNTTVRTKNLPLFSKLEFDQTYGDSLDYLFNF